MRLYGNIGHSFREVSSGVSPPFIDLATKSEIEKHMYDSSFVDKGFSSTYEGEWEASYPVQLREKSKNTFLIGRAGDKLQSVWIDIVISSFGLKPTNRFGEFGRLRWTKNLAHNIFESIDFNFNDITFQSINSYVLDFLAHYNIGKDKIDAYNHYIGNRDELVTGNTDFKNTTLCLLVPAFFSKSKALPVAVLPYNEMPIECNLRPWEKLLTLTNIKTGENVVPREDELTNIPTFSLHAFGNYVIVANDERKRMGCNPYKMVFEHYQTSIYPLKNENLEPVCDLKLKGPVKAFIFATRNKKNPNEWSNYTIDGNDPMIMSCIRFAETTRLIGFNHHTSFVFPFLHADTISKSKGIHMYSYALGKLSDANSSPSCNFTLLTEASIVPKYEDGTDISDCELIVVAISKNILKIGGGVATLFKEMKPENIEK